MVGKTGAAEEARSLPEAAQGTATGGKDTLASPFSCSPVSPSASHWPFERPGQSGSNQAWL